MLSMLCKNPRERFKRNSKQLTLDFNKDSIAKQKHSLFFAFTMAEAVLVMTILGIIATIMITTLKPAEFKEKGLRVLANKVMAEIDNATTQIMLNDSKNGTMENITMPDGTDFSITLGGSQENSDKTAQMYKKYLATTRKQCIDSSCSCYSLTGGSTGLSYFYLKDGSCIAINSGNHAQANTIFPGEDSLHPTSDVKTVIYFDTNDKNQPNTYGKDRFVIPLNKYGIIYDE